MNSSSDNNIHLSYSNKIKGMKIKYFERARGFDARSGKIGDDKNFRGI
jgi:hypothetical protein